MSIRKKILLYFSATVILLTGAAFLFIYALSARNREEEFQQRQKDKITTTLNFLTGIRAIDEDIIQTLDIVTIHNIYNEKLLIFNKDKKLIYSSIDDTPIPFSQNMLSALSVSRPWVEKKEGLYDVIGIYIEHKGRVYYGIDKAYDASGHKKIRFLGYVLISTFICIVAIIVLVSYVLARRITQSIEDVTNQIRDFNFNTHYKPIIIHETHDEVSILAQRFNELMKRLTDAFSFQKHAVHHISHELKTPIAVLVSNFERIESEKDPIKVTALIERQKEDTKDLSEIINSLLEIAKIESGIDVQKAAQRIDELIFDIAEELLRLYPNFSFTVEYESEVVDDHSLTIRANIRLLKAALTNLMVNCIRYSSGNTANIMIAPHKTDLEVRFASHGPIISDNERQYLFRHFFRGHNSQGKPGFGLGLVFVNRIIELHGGSVSYLNDGTNANTFTITLPLI
ncbi:HAMP domain-containing sensor histidine kinase [Polluticoccus soli]|uniref:HAMP domain-containing sensor histidine kinase n=1 Tax=Polluticoccus soli TaxID=3034150 RepID=UPI0023E32020|nr:HAMP domain-containing sensor histidine kinase [Flavipsychrobacter sp. JY13-12]